MSLNVLFMGHEEMAAATGVDNLQEAATLWEAADAGADKIVQSKRRETLQGCKAIQVQSKRRATSCRAAWVQNNRRDIRRNATRVQSNSGAEEAQINKVATLRPRGARH